MKRFGIVLMICLGVLSGCSGRRSSNDGIYVEVLPSSETTSSGSETQEAAEDALQRKTQAMESSLAAAESSLEAAEESLAERESLLASVEESLKAVEESLAEAVSSAAEESAAAGSEETEAAGESTDGESPGETEAETEEALPIPYEELLEGPEQFEGMQLRFVGEVIQDASLGDGNRQLLVRVNGDDNTRLVAIYPEALLPGGLPAGDGVTVAGEFTGVKRYQTGDGEVISYPTLIVREIGR